MGVTHQCVQSHRVGHRLIAGQYLGLGLSHAPALQIEEGQFDSPMGIPLMGQVTGVGISGPRLQCPLGGRKIGLRPSR